MPPSPAVPSSRPRSLRHRLLLLTLATAGMTLIASGFLLSAVFRDHVRQQFIARLSADLDQVMAQLEVDAQGQPMLDASRLSDPRWTRPRSGVYWQVDGSGVQVRPGLLRSRSLWDELLSAPPDEPASGELHVHEVTGPGQAPLLLIERSLRADGAKGLWRVMVAAEAQPLAQAAARFDRALVASLLVLLLLLTAGALLQVTLGLAPLRRLHAALVALREGRTQRLEGHFPDEVQPVVDGLNDVLDRNAEVLARDRALAGNLAHALKTPLAIMAQGAASARMAGAAPAALAQLVDEQVQLARRHVDWHLARSRAAAAFGTAGRKAPLRPVAEGLVRVMQKVHADRGLALWVDMDPLLAFAGESQDLQEMLGNLLDNACKAARRQVKLTAIREDGRLRLMVEDDGPGIPESLRAEALKRGGRLDESTPGSGLGLAIVEELARLYGGTLALEGGTLGGLRAVLVLPAA